MHLKARTRVICFKVAIENDLAMMGTMRLESMQRYYHARHGNDYLFVADYNRESLEAHLKGKEFELIDIVAHKAEPYVAMKKVLGAFSDALAEKTSLRREFLRKPGRSGKIYRAFINNYFKITPGCRYLELGSGDGSAFAAALYGNSLQALAVDDWSGREDSRRAFMANLLCVHSPASRFGMLDKALGEIFPSTLGPRSALYVRGAEPPGPELLGQILESTPIMPALLAVEGWNFAPNRAAWLEALEQSGFEAALSFSVLTSFGEHAFEQKHNPRWGDGYFICLLTPKSAGAKNQ